jgi:hypothetical protein
MKRTQFLENLKGKTILEVVFSDAEDSQDTQTIVALRLDGGTTLYLNGSDGKPAVASFERTAEIYEREQTLKEFEKASVGGLIRFRNEVLSSGEIEQFAKLKSKELNSIYPDPLWSLGLT